MKNGPKYGFGTGAQIADNIKDARALPGPGAHDPEHSKIKQKGPSYGFG